MRSTLYQVVEHIKCIAIQVLWLYNLVIVSTQTMNNNTCWQMIGVFMRNKQGLLPLFEKHHITGLQAYTLVLLAEDGKKPMSRLSHSLQCDASNVTILVDRLEALGLIQRLSDKEDRRVKLLSLTPKGKKTYLSLKAGLSQFENKCLKRSGQKKQSVQEALQVIDKFVG